MICELLAMRPISHITKKTLSYLHSTKIEQMTKTMVILKEAPFFFAAFAAIQYHHKLLSSGSRILATLPLAVKYGRIKPLRDKKTETVSKAFDDIFKSSKRLPKMIWTDKGSEYISKHFKEFLKSAGIQLYHIENEEKSSVVERWNKTMKNRTWKMFTTNNNTVYWDKIDKLVDDYNNTRHSSVKMTPVNASKKENEEKVFTNLYSDFIYLKPEKPKFVIGESS